MVNRVEVTWEELQPLWEVFLQVRRTRSYVSLELYGDGSGGLWKVGRELAAWATPAEGVQALQEILDKPEEFWE